MKQKYEKPSYANLGNQPAKAEGICWSGSSATSFPPGSNDCISGTTASGAGCAGGTFATDTQACNTGAIPQYFGCQGGSFVHRSGVCSQGSTPI